MGNDNVVIWIGLATFFATFMGPVLAVEVSRRRDAQRAVYQRKLDLFRTLMRTRRTSLSSEYVAALNLIEVEFHDVDDVIVCWRRFLDMVNSPSPTTQEDHSFEFSRRRQIIDEMLGHMAKNLGMTISKIPVSDGGYVPMGHVDSERESDNIRKFYSDVALGKRKLPVSISREK